ncbi:sugar ABC transporter permease [Paenibacillus sp. N3.4]|uniref:ABC transporter permease n=1 Tax=Paenibacillus sp. N3.4 TaxID=2603222 RepID=UPI0011CC6377|nr:ABC transporter permease subunit [Paenibacillus sp. N3.4]TXK85314.1 sugar ABC transporter permease [Paenibacillus sp. N3.4]
MIDSNPAIRAQAPTRLFCRKLLKVKENLGLYVLVLPALIYVLLFEYVPLYGVLIAFENFKPVKGILGSEWVGLYHFERFFKLDMFWTLIKNTLSLSLYSLLAGFPIPIILALALNSANSKRLKNIVQTVTYAPHFISTVILVGMLNVFLAPRLGIVSQFLNFIGLTSGPLMILSDPGFFGHLYVWSGVWQGMGWGSIIYLAALSGVDTSLHEAAIVDGANKFQRAFYIDLPSIMPTIVTLLILNCGGMLGVGFEKAFLMQNALNLGASEVISTYVYKVGLLQSQYSFSAAVGLFNSVVNLLLLLSVNKLAKKLGQSGIF